MTTDHDDFFHRLANDGQTTAEKLIRSFQGEYKSIVRNARPLVEGLNVTKDIEYALGEALETRLVVAPSLFLPAPQAGRHGVIAHTDARSATVHLHFGFPLEEDPATCGITAQWLRSGGWHYTIQLILGRLWPKLEDGIRASTVCCGALADMFAAHGCWRNGLKKHLQFGLKVVMEHRIRGVPIETFREIALLQRLCQYEWIVKFLLRRDRATDLSISHRLLSLPAAIERDQRRRRGVSIRTPGPSKMNSALIAGWEAITGIAVPRAWSERAVQAIETRWSACRASIVRLSSRSISQVDEYPIIAFGLANNNRYVARAMRFHSIQPGDFDERRDVLILWVWIGPNRHDWLIALASDDPEAAAAITPSQIASFNATRVLLRMAR